MMHRNNDGSGMAFLAGAVVGGLAGAAIALLLAPKEGSEFREDISNTMDEFSETVGKILNKTKRTVEEAISDGLEEGSRIVGEAKERAENLIRDADDRIAAAKDRVGKAVNAKD